MASCSSFFRNEASAAAAGTSQVVLRCRSNWWCSTRDSLVPHHSLQLASNRPQYIDKVDETMLPRVGIITTDLQATAAAIENVAGLQQVVLLGRRR